MGFIGLAECLTVLTGKHHGEAADVQELGLPLLATCASGWMKPVRRMA